MEIPADGLTLTRVLAALPLAVGCLIRHVLSISFGLKMFSGICGWREITTDEKTISCTGLKGGGSVEYGILNITKEEKKIITIDGKDIEISIDSYNAFKDQFIK